MMVSTQEKTGHRETAQEVREKSETSKFSRGGRGRLFRATLMHRATHLRCLLMAGLGMMLLSNVEAVRIGIDPTFGFSAQDTPANSSGVNQMRMNINITNTCLLYTSDAADE